MTTAREIFERNKRDVMAKAGARIQIDIIAKCLRCKRSMAVKCQWYKGKPFIAVCAKCSKWQQIYPEHKTHKRPYTKPRIAGPYATATEVVRKNSEAVARMDANK